MQSLTVIRCTFI